MFGKKKEMSPAEKKAKLKALGAAKGMAEDMLKGQLGGLKKVTVASDSKEGLKKGLDKAEEMMGEEEESDESPEAEYESDEEDMLAGCDSEEEIDDLIQKLMEKKKSLKA